jgi:hypothetical protein
MLCLVNSRFGSGLGSPARAPARAVGCRAVGWAGQEGQRVSPKKGHFIGKNGHFIVKTVIVFDRFRPSLISLFLYHLNLRFCAAQPGLEPGLWAVSF